MSALKPVIDYLERRTGLIFSQTHLPQVEQAIVETMGSSAPSQFVEELVNNKQLFDQMIARVTINETYFFRDNNHFELIRNQLIPEFVMRHGMHNKYKIWSAGCSTGEEAYSLAMLMAEVGMLQRSTIIGTDIDTIALDKARKAVYGEWSFRNTSKSIRKYFTVIDGLSHLRNEIKEHVVFSQLNLSSDRFPSFARELFELDLIMCRNVLIYFDLETIKKVATGMYESLNDNGVVICGPSDPTLNGLAPFHLTILEGLSYYTKRPMPAQASRAKEVTITQKTLPKASTVRPVKSVLAVNLPAKAGAPGNFIAEAENALKAGHYGQVISLTASHLRNQQALLLHIKATASATSSQAALELLTKHLPTFPISTELHYLAAILQIDCNRLDEAQRALVKTLYLSPGLAIGHFTLAILQKRNGDKLGAKKSLRNALEICSKLDKTAILELSDGETAGRISELAKRELISLDS